MKPKEARLNILQQINQLMDTQCDTCPIKEAFLERFGGGSCKFEKHCNTQCPVGSQIQMLGKQLRR